MILKVVILIVIASFAHGQIYGPCPSPPDFPWGIPLHVEPFRTFSNEVKVPYAYVADPHTAQDVVALSNWAYRHGFRIRPMGGKQSWAPLLFALSDNGKICPKVILASTKNLNSIKLNPPDSGNSQLHTVTVGPGVRLRHLLDFLEEEGLGLFSSPTAGTITVGGMLAIGGHGSGAPSEYDNKSKGHSYGTVSNLIVEMTIVAWDETRLSYTLKTIHRSSPEAKAFLVNLGRTFITSVTLRVGKDQMLRSQSHFFLPVKEVFEHPSKLNSDSKSLSKFVESYGRVNVIGMNSGNESHVWMLTWKVEPMKPPRSRRVLTPYNYHFMNGLDGELFDPFLKTLVQRVPSAWSFIAIFAHPFIWAGSILSRSRDYWGPSKNHLLYFLSRSVRHRPTNIAVLTSKENLQQVAYLIRFHFDKLHKEYEANLTFPAAGIFDIRVTGIDNPNDIGVSGAEPPSLSIAKPMPEYPEYDLVLWCDITAYPETPKFQAFSKRLQDLYYRDIHGKYGIVKFEWSKGWGHTTTEPWVNSTVINHIPRTFSNSDELEEWNWVVNKFNEHDPHHTFSNDYLDQLFLV